MIPEIRLFHVIETKPIPLHGKCCKIPNKREIKTTQLRNSMAAGQGCHQWGPHKEIVHITNNIHEIHKIKPNTALKKIIHFQAKTNTHFMPDIRTKK